jgi:hypothetical protein
MDNQKTNGTTTSNSNASASAPADVNSLKAERPVPVTRSTGATDTSSKVSPRKGATGKKGTARRPDGAKKTKGPNASADKRAKGSRPQVGAKSSKRPTGKTRFSRKQIIIALFVVIFVFDAIVMSLWYFGNRSGPAVPPNPEPYSLIQSQMSNNRSIAEVGYDSALTFANYSNLAIVNTASLKPIENNLLKSGGAPGGGDSLYDEQIVGRVLKLNSDWVNYLNRGDQTVLASVQEGSAAQAKLTELGAGSLVAYHRLAIGEIRRSGKNYYLITQASYTLTKDGQLDIHDELFVYKLVARGATMLVVDFEQIPVGSLQGQPTGTAGAGEGADGGGAVAPADAGTGTEGTDEQPADEQPAEEQNADGQDGEGAPLSTDEPSGEAADGSATDTP